MVDENRSKLMPKLINDRGKNIADTDE